MSSCFQDCCGPESQPQSIFDIYIDPMENYGRLWLIATTTDGDLIAYKEWDDEVILSLKGDVNPEEKVNILMVTSSSTYSSNVTSKIMAFTNVSPGGEWQIGQMAESPKSVGTYLVRFNGLEQQISGLLAYQGERFLIQNQTCSNTGEPQCSYELKKFDNSKPAFFSITPGESSPLYFSTDTLRRNGTYVYNFNKVFKPFDNVVQFKTGDDVLQADLAIGGIQDGQWYLQSRCGGAFQNATIQVGFNNGFSKYFSSLYYSTLSKSYLWKKLSDAPSSADFTFPEEDFSIIDQSMENFDFTVQWNKPLWYVETSYNHGKEVDGKFHYLSVNIIAPSSTNGLKLKSLPEEIAKASPVLRNFNDAKLGAATFVFTPAPVDYEIHLHQRLGAPHNGVRLQEEFFITKSF